MSLQLKGLFTSNGAHYMLDWKDYKFIEILFLLNWGSVDQTTGYNEDTKPTKESMVYSEFILKFYSRIL